MAKSLRSFAAEPLGGASRTVDASGNLVDDIRYKAFGETRSGGTATPTDKRFTGQTLDASTGLYDYGARLYAPALGRFISPDPVVPNPKNPQSLDRYSYALNNPLRYIDPTGYDDEDTTEPESTQEPEAPEGDPNSYDLDWAGGGPDPSGIPPDWDIPSPEVAPEPMPEPEAPQPVLWVPDTDSPEPAAPEVEAPAEQHHADWVVDWELDIPVPVPLQVWPIEGYGETTFLSGPLAGETYAHGGAGITTPGHISVSAMVGRQESPGGTVVNVLVPVWPVSGGGIGVSASLTVDASDRRITGGQIGIGVGTIGLSVQQHVAGKKEDLQSLLGR